ncbi:MAG TPA: hypothetical protein VL462_00745 [Candidatus Nitrosotalea sp.]|nr:hypothetical protein [Candidatus Nitrosotalea sp.]
MIASKIISTNWPGSPAAGSFFVLVRRTCGSFPSATRHDEELMDGQSGRNSLWWQFDVAEEVSRQAAGHGGKCLDPVNSSIASIA